MSKTMNLTTKVGMLAPKSVFSYGGVNWIVLENEGSGVMCLAEKILFEKAFDEADNNNWEDSSLREYLNNEFLEDCVLNGAGEAAFLPMELNLTSDDGLDDYGSTEDLIGLISCEQYRKHRRIIPNANDWWWTITPYSTKANGYSRNVRNVISDGTLNYTYAYDGYGGVRPLCTLKSEILVSVIHKEGDCIASDKTEEEQTKIYTPEGKERDNKLEIKDVNNKFLECIDKAQERYLTTGGGELDTIIRAINMINEYKDGLPL